MRRTGIEPAEVYVGGMLTPVTAVTSFVLKSLSGYLNSDNL